MKVHRLMVIVLIISMFISITALVGCVKRTTPAKGPEVAYKTVQLVVSPAVAKGGRNAKTTILGSGLTPGEAVKIMVVMHDKRLKGVEAVNTEYTHNCKPLPVANEIGAFMTVMTLTGFKPGIYVIELADKDYKPLATAALQIAAAKKKKKK